MTSILKSTMATYLLDEEVEFEMLEQLETQEVEQRTQYPEGFFSSL
ncbi:MULTISPECIES: hypothetical protein [unclassified Lysinibacillus]|nr:MULTISPECIES: hypothetical protein [unclassified Lysinibacillus]